MKQFASYIAEGCRQTYYDLEPHLETLALTILGLHLVYYARNQYLGELDSLLMRLLVVTSLVILIILPRFRKSTKISNAFPIYAIVTLSFSGPMFISYSLLAQTAVSGPIDGIIERMQHEFIASVCIFVIATRSILFGVIAIILATLVGTSIATIAHEIQFHKLDDLEPITSLLWVALLLFVTYVSKNKILEANAKQEIANIVSGNIAHEIRTPLATISNYSASLNSFFESRNRRASTGDGPNSIPETIKSLPEKIRQEVRYSNIIIDMLLVSNRDFETTNSESKIISLSSTVRVALEKFPFNNTFERSIPTFSSDQDLQVFANELLLTHVFYNLLKNTIRYSQKNAKPKVTLNLQSSSRQLIFQDNGPGVPPQNIKHIFDRFFTTEDYGQGTGIGLSFCKSTMEAIGGRIECESVVGEYTRFILTFPEPHEVDPS